MYNTGNPVPSTALEDMADNAQTFDALVTQTEGTTTDRLGRTRRVFQQILMDMGFQPLSSSFQTGATITTRNQCLHDTSTGTFYSWNGALPKVVPAGSTPATAGGIGALLWVDRTDLMLRSYLASANGSSAIGRGSSTVDADLTALETKILNTKTVYVTDYAGYSTDIGAVISGIIDTELTTNNGVTIVVPPGIYPQISTVNKTLQQHKSVELHLATGANIQVNLDIDAYKIIGDSTNRFTLSGTGKINANFGTNSATSTALYVEGFRFPKSLNITGAVIIGTTTHDVNWKTGFHLVDCDTPIVSGLHLQEASTTAFGTALRLQAINQQTTDLRFVNVTTGGHKYFVEAYNHRTGEGLEGIQFIDCSFFGSCIIQNMVSPLVYGPPQVWFKGCHINNPSATLPVITIVSYNSLRIEDCDVYNYSGAGFLVADSCTQMVVSNTDLYWQGGAVGNSIILGSSFAPCGALTLDGFRDHTSDATGTVVLMTSDEIYGIEIRNCKKDAIDKPWITNTYDVNWGDIVADRGLAYGFSAGDKRLLVASMVSSVGPQDISSSVGNLVRLTTAGNINAINGRYNDIVTFICEVVGQLFTHNANLLLAGSVNAKSTTVGATITFAYQGHGVYREISRSSSF